MVFFRSILYPVSAAELSFQVRSIRLDDLAVAVALVGFASAVKPFTSFEKGEFPEVL